ncbi:MAG: replication protein DnaC [Eubacteriales bacterium]|nr:replication protein DnaC [Eubacteriales bacterium]
MVCPKCQGRGLILKNDNWAEICPCTRQEALQKRFRTARLPREMENVSFKDFSFEYYSRHHFDENRRSYYDLARAAFEAAREFAARVIAGKETEGLYFTGPVGSGKTFLACCIANAVLRAGREVLFVVVPDLLDEIRATFDGDQEVSEQELVESARRAPLLILDDLGAHNYSEWTRNRLYSIINYRASQQLPTVITSNISLEDLDRYVGERTRSRIFQMCRAYRLNVKDDIRYLKRIRHSLEKREASAGGKQGIF